jgi:hypothetical protein
MLPTLLEAPTMAIDAGESSRARDGTGGGEDPGEGRSVRVSVTAWSSFGPAAP